MTVCIASIAAKSKAIVMVSDKAVAYGGNSLVPMVADTGARKFLRIGNTFWYALIAGDPSFAFQVIKTTEKTLLRRSDCNFSDTVDGMMHCLRSSYQKSREAAVEDRILRPRLLSKNLVVARPTTVQPLGEEITLAVMTLAKEFKTDSSLLVCGFDANRAPHIFSVTNPGKCDLHDITGFYAVGIGATTAIARLLILEAREEDRLELALYQSFDAKVNAEIVEDVGFNWDVEVLVPGRTAIKVPDKIARVIEKAYNDLPLTPLTFGSDKHFKKVAAGLTIKREAAKKLSDFAKDVLEKGQPMKPSPRRKSSPKKSKSKP